MSGRRLTSAQKLEIIRVAIYSIGDTINAGEALAIVASLFHRDPVTPPLPRERLAELLAAVNAVTPRPKRNTMYWTPRNVLTRTTGAKPRWLPSKLRSAPWPVRWLAITSLDGFTP